MTDPDIAMTAQLLSQLEPGFLPYPIFEEISRIVALPILELVPLRLSDSGDVEVLLLDRGPDDEWWPKLLHTPGVVMRADDIGTDTYDSRVAYERLVRGEMADTQLSEPHFVGNVLQRSKRGTEAAQVYWAEVMGEPKVGKFYPFAQLPDGLIAAQHHFIPLAVDEFKKAKHVSNDR